MKKVILFILCFFSFFMLFAAGEEETNEEIDAEKTRLLSYAKYYGLDEDIHLIKDPKTIEDYANNVLYNALLGEYSSWIAFSSESTVNKILDELDKQYWRHHGYFDELTDTYYELLSYYRYGGFSYDLEKHNGTYYLKRVLEPDYDAFKNVLSEKELFEQQTQAIDELIEVSKSFHENGTIRDDMSELEIAEVYLTYVNNKLNESSNYADISLLSFIHNNNRWSSFAVCSVFNILLRIEGLKTQICETDSDGIASRILADGNIYYVNVYDRRIKGEDSVGLKSFLLRFDGNNVNCFISFDEKYGYLDMVNLPPSYKYGVAPYLTTDRTTPDVWEAPGYEKYAKKKCETLYLWGLPDELGPATLTYEEARELAYKTPEEIAARIKTVADVLIYYWSAGFNMKYNGSHPVKCWFNGKACILNNMQCDCTGAAAAAVYLLKGDYDQVGVFRIIGGNDENHWSNWIYTNGKYYHVPFQEAQENFGSLRKFRKKFFVMDNLDQFPILCNGYCHPENTAAVLAFACDGELYPTNGYTYPIEAEGNVQILFWRPDNHAKLRFIDNIYECEYGWKNQKENHPKIRTAAITRNTINYDEPRISEKDLQIEREYNRIMNGYTN